jgi:RNA polymerase sigma-70 factor (ECF subfamily)
MSDAADTADVADLFRQFGPVVYRYCRTRLGPADAHDAVGEVFVVALRRADEIPDQRVGWLLGVARKVVANQLRTRRRARALFDRATVHAADFFPDVAEAAGERDAVLRAWASLRRADREVIALLATQDLAPADLGVALGCSAGAAAVRAHRARARLQRAIEAEEAAAEPPARPHVAPSPLVRPRITPKETA